MSIKDFLAVNEEHAVTNAIAGISLLIALALLHVYINPVHDFFSFVLDIGFALIVGALVYTLSEFIRKKIG